MKNFCLMTLLAMAWGTLLGLDARAGELELTIEIPRLNVSEYHRPYVAAWIQDDKRKVVANLTVWYQMKETADGVGTKWLPDLRQWWRRSGRSLDLPIDGVTGATRPVGEHTLNFSDKQAGLAKAGPGSYTLVVEAAREVGGREMLEIPFSWPVEKAQTLEAQGSEELGKISLHLKH